MAAPAWASTVQIQDDAHVLNARATLPVGIYIWTTTQDAASKSAFDTDVRTKVSATFPIVSFTELIATAIENAESQAQPGGVQGTGGRRWRPDSAAS